MERAELDTALAALPGWALIEDGRAIHRRYRVPTFAAAFDLVARIAGLAEAADHHPDLGLGWGYVTIRLHTHDTGGVSPKDLALAAEIAAIAPATPLSPSGDAA